MEKVFSLNLVQMLVFKNCIKMFYNTKKQKMFE